MPVIIAAVREPVPCFDLPTTEHCLGKMELICKICILGMKCNTDIPLYVVELCPIKVCWWGRVSVYIGYVGGRIVLWSGKNLAHTVQI
jgi:hypothetical protein